MVIRVSRVRNGLGQMLGLVPCFRVKVVVRVSVKYMRRKLFKNILQLNPFQYLGQ